MMNSDPPLSGEARLKAKRSAFWRYVAIALGVSFVAGAATGAVAALVTDGVLPTGLIIALWLAGVIAFAWFTRDYFRRIDEVDLQDNLWASTISFYVYTVTLGSWFLFHEIGLMSKPQEYIIAAITFSAFFVAYGVRKLGWR